MNLFEKFINKRIGRFLWLLLIVIVVFVNQNNVIAWVITAGLTWFAITYSQKRNPSNHKNLWKIFALVFPLPGYILYILNLEFQLQKKLVVHKDTRRTSFLKLYSLIVGILFIVSCSAIIYGLYTLQVVTNSILTNHQELERLELEIDKTQDETTNFQDNRKYDLVLNDLNKEFHLLDKVITDSESYEKNPLIVLFPQEKEMAQISTYRYKRILFKRIAYFDWFVEVSKKNPDKNKIQNLFNKAQEEIDSTEVILTDVNKLANLISESKKDTFHYYFRIVLASSPIFLLGITSIVTTYWLAAIRFKSKTMFSAICWTALELLNILMLLLFIYAIYTTLT